MSAARPKSSTLAISASCAGCEWFARSANALGIAAIHHDTTGHVVTVVLERTVVYGRPSDALEAAGQTTLDEAIATA